MMNSLCLCPHHKRMIFGRKRFAFNRGFNAVIGPNGSGKSTLLLAVYKCRECKRHEDAKTRYQYFDGEKMNPHRVYKYFRGLRGTVIRTRALFSSHGETMGMSWGRIIHNGGIVLFWMSRKPGMTLNGL